MQGAIVVADPRAAQIAHAYVAECEAADNGWHVRVFTSLADARHWLDLPEAS